MPLFAEAGAGTIIAEIALIVGLVVKHLLDKQKTEQEHKWQVEKEERDVERAKADARERRKEHEESMRQLHVNHAATQQAAEASKSVHDRLTLLGRQRTAQFGDLERRSIERGQSEDVRHAGDARAGAEKQAGDTQ